MGCDLKISEFDYALPEEKIAKFPLSERDESKLLVYKNGNITHKQFKNLGEVLPQNSLLVFNNTKVVRARIIMHKPSGARIELFCLEPHNPSDYERAFAVKQKSEWLCIIGNLKKWKEGALEINFDYNGTSAKLRALKGERVGKEHIVCFEWDIDLTFGQLLEHLGKVPIPPYLNRESEEIDNTRYQTVYSKFEGSVAAPTAGLHFTNRLINELKDSGIELEEITLHVGAGTFLPVKDDSVEQHTMHTEHFIVGVSTLKKLIDNFGKIIPVGTTSVRTLESLAVLGYRVMQGGNCLPEKPVGQWEIYEIPDSLNGKELLETLLNYMQKNDIAEFKAATQIMIAPPYKFKIISAMITNFHQPRSTLLLLVSALVGEDWRRVYNYAMKNDFRFLSYGDSSILFSPEEGELKIIG